MQFLSKPKLLTLLLSAHLGVATLAVPTTSYAVTTDVHSFNIPAGKLDDSLNKLATIAGIELHLDASLSQKLQSPLLQGNYNSAQALNMLLANSGLYSVIQADGSYRILTKANENRMILDTINVAMGDNYGITRDEAGKHAIYDEDISSVYTSIDEIERYKGKDAADLFKGMLNVYSGDARNGGGVDPSIRGVQGPGRVPLSIDGTEQAITVWRGYRGVSNRNYVDSNLIGSIKAIKGPSLTPNAHTSVGGGVQVSTINASDVLLEGETSGGGLVVESSNNAVDPKLPTLFTGQDYREVEGFPQMTPNFAYGDPSLWQEMSGDKENNPLSGEDYAYRLALATRQDSYELLAAYAYRNKGNYFSGTRKSEFYNQPNDQEFNITKMNPRSLAHRQRPGYEVPNTSSELESFLLKGEFNISENQQLNLGARVTNAQYGEIMASRAGDIGENGEMAQWPLSKVEAQAYNIKYQWNPKSKLINVTSNLWSTHTISNTNSAGGFPNYANAIWELADPDASPIIRNTAVANNRENRFGFDVSNQMMLSDELELIMSARYQYHKIRSEDEYRGTVDGWKHWPREGRREELEGQFNFKWMPTDSLIFTAGASYKSYWAIDDFLSSRIAAEDERFTKEHSAAEGVYLEYKTAYTEAEHQELREQEREQYGDSSFFVDNPAGLENFLDFRESERRKKHKAVLEPWLHNGEGKYRRANNICVNGELNNVANYIEGSCRQAGGPVNEYGKQIDGGKKKGNHWAPAFAATYLLNEHSRVYIRYTEGIRFPSMFESTLGFSANNNPYTDIKPEHTYNYETAFVHNFEQGDIKLTYFHHKTKDVIERSGNLLRFYNIDKQTLQGFEFQGRYDNGSFFADLSLSHMTKNEVCDESLAITQDPVEGSIPNCVHAGFAGGYLSDQAIPNDSVNLSLGGRYFENALETGLRSVYLSASKSEEDLERDKALTFDAYAKYSWSERLNVELIATNLTDLYYIDPLVRSSVPAPGRTVKLKLQMSF
ncbi:MULTISPECIES: TonB-dependent receptor [unclassified Pseudoalteromonas]|uniref:TonB-dependent receptor n=1 Tax=unclassified Pseudoalteromonas TaxID=194690 RepID=UPI0025B36825|nr:MULTISPECIES: TonB-dependent receptor [unclassified Pseudoalteromonas]MDN3378617.1 TonB-dependent receptor [Pseudoalteromonas sp. APC 3893]MDN3386971.1 TonB-dependent receptor [Pseudoalteromonas sp. APC 4017]